MRLVATGIAQIDDLLDGGLPVGAISEITGPASSGRTSIALAFLPSARRMEMSAHGSMQTITGSRIGRSKWNQPEASSLGPLQKWHVKKSSASIQQAVDKKHPWTRLDQAIRATDLLLQAGGFAAIVLDLANEAIEHGRRIPLATWYRFRQTANRTRCSLIVLGKAAYAQSSAAVVLECQPNKSTLQWAL